MGRRYTMFINTGLSRQGPQSISLSLTIMSVTVVGILSNILQTKYPMMWRDCFIIVFVARVIMAVILYRWQTPLHPVLYC